MSFKNSIRDIKSDHSENSREVRKIFLYFLVCLLSEFEFLIEKGGHKGTATDRRPLGNTEPEYTLSFSAKATRFQGNISLIFQNNYLHIKYFRESWERPFSCFKKDTLPTNFCWLRFKCSGFISLKKKEKKNFL